MTKYGRRQVLHGLAAGGAAWLTGGCAMDRVGRSPGYFFGPDRPIGLQLYTLGEEVAQDIGATFARVAAIGYRHVQLPGLYGKDPGELARLAGAAGLAITSLHVPIAPSMSPDAVTLASEPQLIAETLGKLGVKEAVVPIMQFPPFERPTDGSSFQQAIGRAVAAAGADLWKQTAATLNERAELLKPFGIRVGYHNHNLEFAPVDGTTGWEILTSQTDPALVDFEVDVAWVAMAGHDPVTELGKLAGRVTHLHVKDVAAGVEPNFALMAQTTSVGAGMLDWASILPAAARAGVRHYYVEQEPPFSEPRIDAIAASWRYLSQLRA